ncbi:MAG: hypothetical protein IT438_02475 [Phycisphaerales bacterium]|nr:hypothetical protein [Phycisphaerales bacterium]
MHNLADDPNATPSVVTPRRSGNGHLVGIVLDLILPLTVSVGLILFGTGLGNVKEAFRPFLLLAGLVGGVMVFLAAPLLWHIRSRRGAADLLSRRVEMMTDSIRLLRDQAALSDDARRVLNRQTERNLLCRAIEEDIQAQAWDAATVLCEELSERFGYRADAEEFRARIDMARSEIQERRVTDAIARLDGLIVQRRWDVALRESARIGRLYPDTPRVENLRQRVESARSIYKQDLERRFLEAAHGGRVDDAMMLLKELDTYLSENDAEPFREVARGVISKARENLGAQFKLAVQDRQWATAAALGRRIINEFPNTRMAQEVRGMMDGILSRANTGASATAVAVSNN